MIVRSIALIISLLFLTWTTLTFASETKRSIANRPLIEQTLETPDGLPVKYYISTGKPDSPLILFIQGSGCKPVMNGTNTEGGSSVYDYLPTAYESGFNAMIVDKPFVGEAGDISSVNGCSQRFNNFFSFDSWLEVLSTAFAHAMENSDASKSDALILGVSEGAVMATALSNKHSAIRDIALIGANGDNQIFDFISLAHSQGRPADIENIVEKASNILADPFNINKFAWGHTYKRWSSFFKASPSHFLKDTKKRVYLVSGTNDQSVPIQSTEFLYSKLILQNTNVTFRRIDGAGHNLLKNGDAWDKLNAEYDLIKKWYLDYETPQVP